MDTCIVIAPSFGADKPDNSPRNDPIGVLVALTITTSFNFTLELYNRWLIKEI